MKKYLDKSDMLFVGICLGITTLLVLAALWMLISWGSSKEIPISDDAIDVGSGPITVIALHDGQEYKYHVESEDDIIRYPNYMYITIDDRRIKIMQEDLVKVDYTKTKSNASWYPFRYDE